MHACARQIFDRFFPVRLWRSEAGGAGGRREYLGTDRKATEDLFCEYRRATKTGSYIVAEEAILIGALLRTFSCLTVFFLQVPVPLGEVDPLPSPHRVVLARLLRRPQLPRPGHAGVSQAEEVAQVDHQPGVRLLFSKICMYK